MIFLFSHHASFACWAINETNSWDQLQDEGFSQTQDIPLQRNAQRCVKMKESGTDRVRLSHNNVCCTEILAAADVFATIATRPPLFDRAVSGSPVLCEIVVVVMTLAFIYFCTDDAVWANNAPPRQLRAVSFAVSICTPTLRPPPPPSLTSGDWHQHLFLLAYVPPSLTRDGTSISFCLPVFHPLLRPVAPASLHACLYCRYSHICNR